MRCNMEGEQPSSFQSLCHVKAAELFPMPSLSFVDSELKDPFNPLYGEAFEALGRASEGALALTNYRFFISYDTGTFHNIPLGVIESIECRDIVYLHVLCKDGRSVRILFPNSERCQDWFRRLSPVTVSPKQIEDHFAFGFFAWALEDDNEQLLQRLSNDTCTKTFQNEVSRLKFNLKGPWRVTQANEEYQLCPTYPRQLLVPASVSDSTLEAVARFRVARRFPVVVWRHQRNGAIIARSSQPEVGILWWRSTEDEELFCAMRQACALDSPTPELEDDPRRKVLIMDARSFSTALANRARGGGVECNEYYKNCDIEFMNLPNIHTVRKSFQMLRSLCSTPDNPSWLSGMENTKWLNHLSGLLSAAVIAAKAVDKDGRPVLVHCSDGWDRTPQIVSLAQILLDPYYRTVQGFETLIQREWLDFGHKFGDRCGNSVGNDDGSERCPVFLQWLDCVHQLLIQFPCSFQYSEPLLVKLAHHTYSNLFGTFLGNSLQERSQMKIFERTFSVWPLLTDKKYKNLLYIESPEVLYPSCDIRDLSLWTQVYVALPSALLTPCVTQSPRSSVLDRTMDGTAVGHSPVLKEIEKPLDNSKETNGETETDGDETPANGKYSPNGNDETDDNDMCNHTSNSGFSRIITSNKNWRPNGELGHLRHGGQEHIEDRLLSCSLRMWPRKEENHDLNDGSLSDHERPPGYLVNNSNGLARREEASELGEDLPDADVMNGSRQGWVRSDERCETHEGILEQPVEHAVDSPEKAVKLWMSKDIHDVVLEQPIGHTVGSPVPSTPIKIPKSIPSPPSSFSDLGASIAFKFAPPRPVFDVDGLEMLVNPVQMRVMRLIAENRDRVAALEQDLRAARLALLRRRGENDSDDQVSTVGTGSDLNLASLPSDQSWEAVEERELQTTLWVPDHAVSECKGCSSRFWIGRRKHHCRKCGNIFCSDCSVHTALLPGEDLYYPVRVCVNCHELLDGHATKHYTGNGINGPNSSLKSTTSPSKTK